MVKTFFNGMSRMLIAVVAVFALVAFCGTTAQAQESAKAGTTPSATVNPATDPIGKLGIVGYNLATFKNVAQGAAKLATEAAALKPVLQNTTPLNRFKYAYYSQILSDLSYDIAPEISVITSLNVAQSNGKADNAEAASLYEYVVNLLK